MRVTTRIHEWLAERVPWIQYPDARFGNEPRFRLSGLSGKQRGWIVFGIFWLSVIGLSIYGNLI